MSFKVAPCDPNELSPRPLDPIKQEVPEISEKPALKQLSIGIQPSETPTENSTIKKPETTLQREESTASSHFPFYFGFFSKGMKIQELLIHKFESKIDQSVPEPHESKVVRPKDKIDKLDVYSLPSMVQMDQWFPLE